MPIQLQALVNDGAIVLFSTSSRPGPFVPPPAPPVAGDQPVAERAQGYPQARGLLAAYTGNILPQQGVSVDELTQE